MLLKEKRIFIIEDDVNNRAIIQTLLEQAGARTEFERWGHTTLSNLQRFMPVDMILLDLMFPNKITGYDLFELIRGVDDYKDIPIVAVSASDPSDAIPRTQQMGFSGFIAKPVDFRMFAQLLHQIFEGEEIWHSDSRL